MVLATHADGIQHGGAGRPHRLQLAVRKEDPLGRRRRGAGGLERRVRPARDERRGIHAADIFSDGVKISQLGGMRHPAHIDAAATELLTVEARSLRGRHRIGVRPPERPDRCVGSLGGSVRDIPCGAVRRHRRGVYGQAAQESEGRRRPGPHSFDLFNRLLGTSAEPLELPPGATRRDPEVGPVVPLGEGELPPLLALPGRERPDVVVEAGDEDLPGLRVLQAGDDLAERVQGIGDAPAVGAGVEVPVGAGDLHLHVGEPLQTVDQGRLPRAVEGAVGDHHRVAGEPAAAVLPHVAVDRLPAGLLLPLDQELDVDRQLAALGEHRRHRLQMRV